MTIPDISNLDVLIIGEPASGKSYLASQLRTKHGGKVIHTDDFISWGYKVALYKLLEFMETVPPPRIVEGVQGYRLLRKGVELNTYFPDLVIELTLPPGLQERTYKAERDSKKLAYLKQFNATHQKILADYKAMPNSRPPKWLTIENSY